MDRFTAIDISAAKFREADFMVMKLFNNWNVETDTDNGKIESIVAGRKACYKFLKKSMRADYVNRNTRVCEQTIAVQTKRQKRGRIVRGVCSDPWYSGHNAGSVLVTNVVEYPSIMSFPSSKIKDDKVR